MESQPVSNDPNPFLSTATTLIPSINSDPPLQNQDSLSLTQTVSNIPQRNPPQPNSQSNPFTSSLPISHEFHDIQPFPIIYARTKVQQKEEIPEIAQPQQSNPISGP